MNLMFWNKKPADENADGSQKNSGQMTGQQRSSGRQSSDPTGDTDAGALDASPARRARRLIIGAAIGVSILAAIGMSAWKILSPSPKHGAAKADAPVSMRSEKQLQVLTPLEFLQLRKAQSKDRPDDAVVMRKKSYESPRKGALKFEPSQVENSENAGREQEMETLKKRNDALQAQIDSLKSDRSQAENLHNASHLAEIAILRKKNEELQSQIGLFRKQQQPPSASPANQAASPINQAASPVNRAAGKVQSPAPVAELATGNSNPKPAATTSKEAIGVMNARPATPTEQGRK